MKPIIALSLGVSSLFAFSQSQAQSFRYANEALLFSQYGVSGTARSVGIGNAQTAIGGDLGSIWLNPAGAGVYNRNEFSVSPTLRFSSNDATYEGSQSYNNRTNFAIQNIGVVFSSRRKDKTEGFLGGSLALSYNQQSNFGNRYSYTGEVADYGLIDGISYAFEEDLEDAITDLAFDNYLVGNYYYYDDANNLRFASTPVLAASANAPYLQQETVKQSGNTSTFSIAYGGNISDKYYFGGGLNLLGVSYTKNAVFSEIYFSDDEVTDITLYEDQLVTGSGVNVSFGFIARPIDAVRIGISYQTPSLISLREEATLNLATNYNNFEINSGRTNSLYLDDEANLLFNGIESSELFSEFEYQLKTPGRLNMGAAYFVGKNGFISADVEYVNYSNARLTDDFNSLSIDNDAVREDYTSAFNYRIGTEWRVDVLRLRAGYSYQGDPYKQQNGLDRFTQTISLGAGMRFDHLYLDLALLSQSNMNYSIPYAYDQQASVVEVDRTLNSGVLTFGVNF